MKLWNDDQQAQSTLAMAQVETARKRVAEACTVAANAEREAERQAALFKQGFVSGSRDEQARAEAQARRAGCDAAKADVAQTQARVNATRVEQSRTVLYAPFAGTVAKIVGEVGEYSTPSPPGVPTPPAIDLIDDTCLYVRAPMDEVDAPKINPGKRCASALTRCPSSLFPARSSVWRLMCRRWRSRPARWTSKPRWIRRQSATALLVGYSADVEVSVGGARQGGAGAHLGPAGRRPRTGSGHDGTLQQRAVKTGLANWEFTEVLEGLAAGDAW
jgi:HlyD family secretion protein